MDVLTNCALTGPVTFTDTINHLEKSPVKSLGIPFKILIRYGN